MVWVPWTIIFSYLHAYCLVLNAYSDHVTSASPFRCIDLSIHPFSFPVSHIIVYLCAIFTGYAFLSLRGLSLFYLFEASKFFSRAKLELKIHKEPFSKKFLFTLPPSVLPKQEQDWLISLFLWWSHVNIYKYAHVMCKNGLLLDDTLIEEFTFITRTKVDDVSPHESKKGEGVKKLTTFLLTFSSSS